VHFCAFGVVAGMVLRLGLSQVGGVDFLRLGPETLELGSVFDFLLAGKFVELRLRFLDGSLLGVSLAGLKKKVIVRGAMAACRFYNRSFGRELKGNVGRTFKKTRRKEDTKTRDETQRVSRKLRGPAPLHRSAIVSGHIKKKSVGVELGARVFHYGWCSSTLRQRTRDGGT